jgi:hypothetical protein
MHAFITENVRDSEIWNFTVQRSDHNYFLITKPGAHAAIRKLYKGKEFKERTAAHEATGMLTRYTYIIDEIKNLDNPFIARDYHNERAKIRRNRFSGKSSIHAFLEALDAFNEIEEASYQFSAEYKTKFDDGGPLIHFFFLHQKHKQLLAANSEVLILDSTYRTNRY